MIKTHNFSWVIDAMNIASFLIQVYSGTAYSQNHSEMLMMIGDTGDKVLDTYGGIFSKNLSKVVIDPLSRYISNQISGKRNSQKVSILMFVKTSAHLKKLFSNKWYYDDLFYGYPWMRNHYLY